MIPPYGYTSRKANPVQLRFYPSSLLCRAPYGDGSLPSPTQIHYNDGLASLRHLQAAKRVLVVAPEEEN